MYHLAWRSFEKPLLKEIQRWALSACFTGFFDRLECYVKARHPEWNPNWSLRASPLHNPSAGNKQGMVSVMAVTRPPSSSMYTQVKWPMHLSYTPRIIWLDRSFLTPQTRAITWYSYLEAIIGGRLVPRRFIWLTSVHASKSPGFALERNFLTYRQSSYGR